MKCSLGISNFLEEISSLSHSMFSSIYLHWSLRKAFLPLLAILWNSAFRCLYLSFSPLLFTSLLFTAICKASSDNCFAFLHFFFLGMVFITASYTMSWTSVHGSSCALSIRSSPLNLFVTSTLLEFLVSTRNFMKFYLCFEIRFIHIHYKKRHSFENINTADSSTVRNKIVNLMMLTSIPLVL